MVTIAHFSINCRLSNDRWKIGFNMPCRQMVKHVTLSAKYECLSIVLMSSRQHVKSVFAQFCPNFLSKFLTFPKTLTAFTRRPYEKPPDRISGSVRSSTWVNLSDYFGHGEVTVSWSVLSVMSSCILPDCFKHMRLRLYVVSCD